VKQRFLILNTILGMAFFDSFSAFAQTQLMCDSKELDMTKSISLSLQAGPLLKIQWPQDLVAPGALGSVNLLDASLSGLLQEMGEQTPKLQNLKRIFLQVMKVQNPQPAALFCTELQSPESLHLFVTPYTMSSLGEVRRLLAHELTHLLLEQNKILLPLWMEEGLATLQEYRAAKKVSGPWLLAHYYKPYVGLMDLDVLGLDDEKELSAYGHAALFFMYLEQRLQGSLLEEALKIQRSNANESFYTFVALLEKKTGQSFQDTFLDFQVAKLINRQESSGKYFVGNYSVKLNHESEKLLNPWSSELVPLTASVAPKGMKDYFVKDSIVGDIQVLPWKEEYQKFKDVYRLRVRYQ